ncbi:DEKNAAC100914 [Brettanomyces naardenensis]|uniref:tRNA-dihydrouridine synthase n=1 Tax=Brettanomyces naardenensis TaxID=13370 RepID=A0A448YH23_BRENA|nr:DEKNAAC100914 [Brettanomyces naardenensis]
MYKADIVYSPMILAREFVRHENARMSDFSTSETDRPLILQIGANNVTDLLRMCEMVQPYVDGIGLNCGCPIKDQVREGIGAALMSKKDLVADMISAVKKKFGDKLTMEIKIRVHPDVNETLEFVKCAEDAGVDFITVHGRTKDTRSSVACDFEKIKLVKQHARVPIVANGDCRSLEDAYRIAKLTGCDGVMAVRGVLYNPGMFAGHVKTPWGAVERFWDLSTNYGLPFRLIQHHLSCMLDGQLLKELHIQLNEANSLAELLDFFDEKFILKRQGEEGFGEAIDVPYRESKVAGESHCSLSTEAPSIPVATVH